MSTKNTLEKLALKPVTNLSAKYTSNICLCMNRKNLI